MQYTTIYASPLGAITLASDGAALTGLWFQGQKYEARGLDREHAARSLPVFDVARRWLDIYFSGAAPDFTPPLRFYGTAFQQAVWRLLTDIPYGETSSYGALARRLAAAQGRERVSARAVGGAVGKNPISIIVPCHRVLGADGALTGYAGGLDRKTALLRLEAGG